MTKRKPRKHKTKLVQMTYYLDNFGNGKFEQIKVWVPVRVKP